MKKVFLLSALIFLIIQSCSSNEPIGEEDNNPINKINTTPPNNGDNNTNTPVTNNSNNVLIKTIKDSEFKDEYLYNGKKLLSRKFYTKDVLHTTINYIYDGDLITGVKVYDEPGNVFVAEEVFTYKNSQLISKYYIDYQDSKSNSKSEYSYNGNGTITELIDGWEKKSTIYTLSNGEIVKAEETFDNKTLKYIFRYDDKNSPFKNIIGYTPFLLEDMDEYLDMGGIKNNITIINTIESNVQEKEIYYTYIYNSDNFPTTLRQCATCSPIEYIYIK